MGIWIIIKLEKDIVVFNLVTKFHKVLMTISGLKRPDMVKNGIIKQRAIAPDDKM